MYASAAGTIHTRTHTAKLGWTGDASVHTQRAGDVMNSSGIVMIDGAVLSAGRVRWRRRNETQPRGGLLCCSALLGGGMLGCTSRLLLVL